MIVSALVYTQSLFRKDIPWWDSELTCTANSHSNNIFTRSLAKIPSVLEHVESENREHVRKYFMNPNDIDLGLNILFAIDWK